MTMGRTLLLAAVLVTLLGVTAASAQGRRDTTMTQQQNLPPDRNRTDIDRDRDRHDMDRDRDHRHYGWMRGHHYGWYRHHHCMIQWHRHHRVRICR